MGDAPGKPCVLVADDDTNLRRILCLFLQNAGFATLEARTGREVVDTARSMRPQVVLLDVMMPAMDGFTACRLLKDDPETRAIPVVICTARNRKEDLVEAIKAGAEDFIVKPFDKETVINKVQRCLAGRKTRTPFRAAAAANRRDSSRKPTGWTLSWGRKSQAGIAPVYKTKVFDISLKGLSFEFVRCETCTGYEQGTVHPLCLFARHGKRFKEAESLDFVLSLDRDVVIEVEGRIAHVYQWPDRPRMEKVGVMFTQISPDARRLIQQYLDGGLAAGESS
jgi:CheY-like chemotaxis protein